MLLRIFTIALFSAAFSTEAGAQQFKDETVRHRAECRKTGTDGCTAHVNDNVTCKVAPAGWAIHVETIKTGSEGAKGRQIICRHEVAKTKRRDTPLGPQTFTGKICVRAHIESGGGGGRIGTVFYNNCKSDYRIISDSVWQ